MEYVAVRPDRSDSTNPHHRRQARWFDTRLGEQPSRVIAQHNEVARAGVEGAADGDAPVQDNVYNERAISCA